MSLQPDGTVLACSRKPGPVLGNIQSRRLAEIWHGKPALRLRIAHERLASPAECGWCSACVAVGEAGIADVRKYEHLELRDVEWPQRLELNLSNACNLECTQCGPELSSAIAARLGVPRRPPVYGDRFFEDLGPFLPHLEEIVFLGGEPFLQQECYRIFDMLARLERPPRCVITTNGTLYDERIARVLERLPVQLIVSLDGATRETVEAIRKNADHAALMAHLHRFREHLGAGESLLLSFCMMRQNCGEFGEFLLMAERLGCPVRINPVTDPRSCSPYTRPLRELTRVIDDLEARSGELQRQLVRNASTLRQGLRLLRSARDGRTAHRLSSALATTRRAPSAWHVWTLLGEDRVEAALDAAERLAAVFPGVASGEIARAQALRRLGRLDEARDVLRRTKRFVDNESDRRALLLEQAWIAEARGDFEETLESAASVRGIGGLDAIQQVQLGLLESRAIRERRGIEEALSHLDALLPVAALTPCLRDVELERGWLLLERARGERFAGRLDDALETLTGVWQLMAETRARSAVLVERAHLGLARGDARQVLALVADGLAHAADAAEHVFDLRLLEATASRVLDDLERAARALELADGAARRRDQRRSLLFERAWQSLAEGSQSKALAACREALALDPTPVDRCAAHHVAARAHAQLDDLKTARNELEQWRALSGETAVWARERALLDSAYGG